MTHEQDHSVEDSLPSKRQEPTIPLQALIIPESSHQRSRAPLGSVMIVNFKGPTFIPIAQNEAQIEPKQSSDS